MRGVEGQVEVAEEDSEVGRPGAEPGHEVELEVAVAAAAAVPGEVDAVELPLDLLQPACQVQVERGQRQVQGLQLGQRRVEVGREVGAPGAQVGEFERQVGQAEIGHHLPELEQVAQRHPGQRDG